MMPKLPQKNAFDVAGKYQTRLNQCKFGASFFSVIFTVLSFFEFYSYLKSLATVISVFSLFVICFWQLRFQSTYREAESIRRDVLIDHSFGTVMADAQSEGYYDSSEIDRGFKKLLASVHESSFLSSEIIDVMLNRQERVTVIGGLFVIAACAASSIQSELFLAILNGFLSLNLINDYCELRALRAEIHTVCDKCKQICEDYINSHRKTFTIPQQAHVIRECLRYECALAYASIMLDEKAYMQLNAAHERKWRKIKTRYYC